MNLLDLMIKVGLKDEASGKAEGVASKVVGTLGKAAGASGAFVAASETVVEWLISRARTYIFTTGSSPIMASARTTLSAISNG